MLKIGRGQQNDIVLDDPDQVVSRFHAELRPDGGEYVLVDLNSQNGTWVNASGSIASRMRTGVPVAIGPYQLSSKRQPRQVTGAPVETSREHSDATR